MCLFLDLYNWRSVPIKWLHGLSQNPACRCYFVSSKHGFIQYVCVCVGVLYVCTVRDVCNTLTWKMSRNIIHLLYSRL